MADSAEVAFLQWALPKLGLRWEGFRNVRGQVVKRIRRRFAALGLEGLDAYRERLEHDPSEWRALDDLCRVTISRFHRDRAVFEHLRRVVLPELARSAADAAEPLRVWSCGCASGEEPWSLAIAFRLEVSPIVPGAELDLVATDAAAGLIERANIGCYEGGTLREVPRGWMDAAFERRGELFCVRSDMRRGVDYRIEDVRRTMPEGAFRLLLCRNVAFTYFDEGTQRAVLDRFVEKLSPGGYLVLGAHERLPPGSGLVEAQGHLPLFRLPRAKG